MILASRIIKQRDKRIKDTHDEMTRNFYIRVAYGEIRDFSPESRLEACHEVGLDPRKVGLDPNLKRRR